MDIQRVEVGGEEFVRIVPSGTPRKFALSRLSDTMAPPDVSALSAAPPSPPVPSPKKLADTIERLMIELERSHKAEAAARQQAANAVAAKQVLTEASNTAVAEMESSLESERQNGQRRLRHAEAERKAQALRLRVDRFLLTSELRSSEGETALAAHGRRLALTEKAQTEQRLTELSRAARTPPAEAPRSPAAEARVAELSAELSALRVQLAPLEATVAALRGEAEARESRHAQALEEARRVREAEAHWHVAALAQAHERIAAAESAAAASKAAASELESHARRASDAAEAAESRRRSSEAGLEQMQTHLERAAKVKAEAAESAAAELRSRLEASEAAATALRGELQALREQGSQRASQASAVVRTELHCLSLALREEEEARCAEARRHRLEMASSMGALEAANAAIADERVRRHGLEETLATRMAGLEGMLHEAIEARENDRLAAEEARAWASEAAAEAAELSATSEAVQTEQQRHAEEAVREAASAREALRQAEEEAARQQALSEQMEQRLQASEEEAERSKQAARLAEERAEAAEGQRRRAVEAAAEAEESLSSRLHAALERCEGLRLENASRESASALVIQRLEHDLSTLREAVDAAATREKADALRQRLAVDSERRQREGELEAALRFERSRADFERRLLAKSLQAEEAVVVELTHSQGVSDLYEQATRSVLSAELRSVERRAATARTHAARALKEAKERAGAARAAGDDAKQAERATAELQMRLREAESREQALEAKVTALEVEVDVCKAAAQAAAAQAAREQARGADRTAGRSAELEEARARWEVQRQSEEEARLRQAREEQARALEDSEEEWAACLAAERAEQREAMRRERERLSEVLEEEVRRRHEAEDALDAALQAQKESEQQRRRSGGGGSSRGTQTLATVGDVVDAAARKAAEREAEASAKELVEAASAAAAAHAEAEAEQRERAQAESHAAVLAEVRYQRDSLEAEVREEQRRRQQAEAAAADRAREAKAEQARWRAAAAEGWLTAGREAKRRQAAQLSRMSDMLHASAATVGLTAAAVAPHIGHPAPAAIQYEADASSAWPHPAAAAEQRLALEAAVEEDGAPLVGAGSTAQAALAVESYRRGVAGATATATAAAVAGGMPGGSADADYYDAGGGASGLGSPGGPHAPSPQAHPAMPPRAAGLTHSFSAPASPMGPARGARPPPQAAASGVGGYRASLATPVTRGGLRGGGLGLPSGPRPPRVRYADPSEH